MSETKSAHTPGPWRYDADCGLVRESPGDDINIGSAELAEVMWVERSGMTDADSERETNANANLMAAAPEMLEALKRAQSNLQICAIMDSSIDTLDVVDAAIALATGGAA